MRITSIRLCEVQVRPGAARRWLFVEVLAADGRVGIAEATSGLLHEAVVGAVGDALASLRAVDLAPGEVPQRLGLSVARLEGDRVAATAVSALESALCDLTAQGAGVPLAAWLGTPRRQSVPLYANVNRSMTGDRSPATFAQAAAGAAAAGFTTFKCAPFDEVTPDLPLDEAVAHAASGIARVRAVREAIGPGVRLLVDCHSRFTIESALRVAPALRALDVGWFEEPLDPLTDAAGLAQVARGAGMTMAGAEMVYGADAFLRIARDAALDVIMPDVKYCGGVQEAVRIGERVAAAGVRFSPHSPSGPVCQLASAHACAVLEDPLPLEYAWGEAEWRAEVLDPPERIEAGALVLPQTSGLGARLNHPLIARHGRTWTV